MYLYIWKNIYLKRTKELWKRKRGEKSLPLFSKGRIKASSTKIIVALQMPLTVIHLEDVS